MSSRIRVAVVGYGNIGKCAVEALLDAPDMELAGVVRRNVHAGAAHTTLAGMPVVNDAAHLHGVQVALLCGPTRTVTNAAMQYAALGIHTVDSFDIHGEALWDHRQQLDVAGKKHGTVHIVSAGWDPGSDSVLRMLMEAMAPRGITYTNFGPGMSMGHTVAVKSKAGVRNALSMTIPAGTGRHRRMVYVELHADADFGSVEQAVKSDAYFAGDDTTVVQVDDVTALMDMGHGVWMERRGVSGVTHNQQFEFRMKINNPALTAQIMVSCVRATMRQQPGACTMPEIPVIDLLPGSRETLVRRFV